MEMYYVVAITDRDKGESMLSLYQNTGMHMILATLGHGTATDSHLELYGLEATEKAVIGAIASREGLHQLLRDAKRKLFIDIPGNGVMMSIPLKSVAGAKTLAYFSEGKEIGGNPPMTFEHELIIVVLNEGFADPVMDAARSAGATGGTVLHAKGTGAVRAEKFFGVSLAKERDMIYIVARSEEKAAIMRAINEQTGPATPAGAICFSLPVSSVAGLRQRDDF